MTRWQSPRRAMNESKLLGSPAATGVKTPTLRRAGAATLALFLTVILAGLLRSGAVAWPLLVLLMALAALAAWRPMDAILLVAALTPLASFLGRRWNHQVAWAEAIVIVFAAGWMWRRLLRGGEDPAAPPPLRLPITIFALVLAAAIGVQLSVDQMRMGTAELLRELWQFLSRDYIVSGSDHYLHAAFFLLEGLLLVSAAASFAASHRGFARRMAYALAGGAAVAAAINLAALIDSGRQSAEFWTRLGHHLLTTRINEHYGDLNAAGSHFAMMLFVAAALGLAGGRTGRGWLVGSAALVASLWISGSRAALVACPVALAVHAIAWGHMRAEARTRRAVWGAAALLAGVAIVVLAYAPMRGNQKSASIATQVRVEMARTTMRMVVMSPAFGIGLGQFYQRSGEFSSPALLKLFPPAVHENAHNNFLQVLAETGVVGFAGFAWVLGAAMYYGWLHVRRDPYDVITWGCLTGLGAFLLTWLAGHPLLTREPAYAFWMLLGTTAGTAFIGTAAGAVVATPALHGGAPIAAALVLVISMPFRSASARAQADFDHYGIGVSRHWQTADDGIRYRSGLTEASIFVPRDRGSRFRVRTLSDANERLELTLGGRLADIVQLPPGRWTDVTLPVRSVSADARFVKLDLRILDADHRAVTLWITKVEPLPR